jgi:AcrR family transcriptional regulator
MGEEITNRQKEIIHAALEIISEKGIQALTIKNLSRKVGFAESAVYRHYRRKAEIVAAILDRFMQKTDYFFDHEMDRRMNAIGKIENLFENHFRTFEESPALVAAIFSEEIFRNEAGLSRMVKKIMDKNISKMSSLIEAGQAEVTIRNDIEPEQLAIILLGALRIFVKMWHLDGRRYALAAEGASFINSIINLIKTK